MKLKIKILSIFLILTLVAVVTIENERIASAKQTVPTVPFSAIFTKFYDTGGTPILYSPSERTNLANLTFNLPVNSYVQADAGGYFLSNMEGNFALLILYVDGEAVWCKIGYAYYRTDAGDFHLSKSFYLPAGDHTIYLDGWIANPSIQALVDGVTITAIANEKGTMQNVLTNPNCASLTESSIKNRAPKSK